MRSLNCMPASQAAETRYDAVDPEFPVIHRVESTGRIFRDFGTQTSLDPSQALPFVRAAPAFPTRGNSRSPSPSFCSPVNGPLNLSSAASRTRFIPKPCAGRWNVPAFGSRAGARNCAAGSRSCMAYLSPQREHSGNGHGGTRAPPAAYQFRRLADGKQTRRQTARGDCRGSPFGTKKRKAQFL
jgi:hypothetical protein